MVYRLMYYIVNVLLRVYFRRIYIDGLSNIPKDKALMIVCNHPMGFVEPILMACLFPIDLNFLVRGDLFENKLLKRFLLATHQIPIYRFKDGFSSLRNNQETMNYVVEVMKKKEALVIFIEGSTDMVMHLRPFKKGMARMALQSLEADPNLEILVLPVGMTFSKGFMPLSEVAISVGKSFSINELIKGETERDNISLISDTAYVAIKEHMVHLTNRQDEAVVQSHWDLHNASKDPAFFPRAVKESGFIKDLKELEMSLNDTELHDEKVKSILNQRKELNIKLPKAMVSGKKNYLGAILAFIPGILGMVLYFIPIGTSFFLQKKLVKQKEFVSAVIIASGGVFSLIWIIVIFILTWIFLGTLNAVLALFLFFVSGICALYLLDFRQRI